MQGSFERLQSYYSSTLQLVLNFHKIELKKIDRYDFSFVIFFSLIR